MYFKQTNVGCLCCLLSIITAHHCEHSFKPLNQKAGGANLWVISTITQSIVAAQKTYESLFIGSLSIAASRNSMQLAELCSCGKVLWKLRQRCIKYYWHLRKDTYF